MAKKEKKAKKKYTSIGGQALMEGIMMRGPEKAVMAVRRMDGSITTEGVTLSKPTIWNKIPIIRGVVGFAQSISMGTKMLMRSADLVIEDEERAAEAEEAAARAAEEAAAAEEVTETAPAEVAEAAEEVAETAPAEVAEAVEEVTETAPAEGIEAVEEVAETAPAEVAEAVEEVAETAPAEDIDEEAAAAAEAIAMAIAAEEAAAEAAALADDDEAPYVPAAQETVTASASAVPAADVKNAKAKESKGKGKDKKSSDSENGFFTVIATVLGFGLAILLFFFMPTWAFKGLLMILPEEQAAVLRDSTVWKSVIEGVLKLIIFIVYMLLVSNMKEIKRLFQYHGAEHKTIFCYEAGEELTVENVRKFKRFHPRCGTSFLILMLIVGILAGICITAVLPPQYDNNPWIRPLIKLALIPLIMGVGYELLKFAGKHDNIITRIISAPGLWMQRISTREPDDSQIECAIAALKPVIPEDGGDMS